MEGFPTDALFLVVDVSDELLHLVRLSVVVLPLSMLVHLHKGVDKLGHVESR